MENKVYFKTHDDELKNINFEYSQECSIDYDTKDVRLQLGKNGFHFYDNVRDLVYDHGLREKIYTVIPVGHVVSALSDTQKRKHVTDKLVFANEIRSVEELSKYDESLYTITRAIDEKFTSDIDLFIELANRRPLTNDDSYYIIRIFTDLNKDDAFKIMDNVKLPFYHKIKIFEHGYYESSRIKNIAGECRKRIHEDVMRRLGKEIEQACDFNVIQFNSLELFKRHYTYMSPEAIANHYVDADHTQKLKYMLDLRRIYTGNPTHVMEIENILFPTEEKQPEPELEPELETSYTESKLNTLKDKIKQFLNKQ